MKFFPWDLQNFSLGNGKSKIPFSLGIPMMGIPRAETLFRFHNFLFCSALKEFNQTDIRGTRFEELCPRPPPCDNFARFRTYDGSCNNLENPKFGWTFTPYQRILPNAYHDSNYTMFENYSKCRI